MSKKGRQSQSHSWKEKEAARDGDSLRGTPLDKFGELPLSIIPKDILDEISALYIKNDIFEKMIKYVKARSPKEMYGFIFGNMPNTVEEIYVPPKKYQAAYGGGVDITAENMREIMSLDDFLDIYGNYKFMLGWFHSHPTFGVFYSGKDVQNQATTFLEGLKALPRVRYKREVVPLSANQTINAEYNKGKVKLYDPLGFGVNIGISRTGGKEMLEVLKRHPAISLEADSDITLHMCYGVTLNVNREAHPELWLMSRKSNFEGSNLARRLNKYSKGVKPTVKLLGSKEK